MASKAMGTIASFTAVGMLCASPNIVSRRKAIVWQYLATGL